MFRTALIAAALLVTGPTVAEAQPAGDRVEVNGMRMYYEVSGAGDPLIVLHGAYMNIPTMGAIIPRLAETHKVYALELQGHGGPVVMQKVGTGRMYYRLGLRYAPKSLVLEPLDQGFEVRLVHEGRGLPPMLHQVDVGPRGEPED